MTESRMFAFVKRGQVQIDVLKPASTSGRISVDAVVNNKECNLLRSFGDTLDAALAKLRESVERESAMAPTKTARARAARVLRVLDAAKKAGVYS